MFRLASFQPKLKISRRVSQKDKFFLFDVGVRNSILGLHRHPVSQDQVGALFEHWLVLQVIYLNRALRKEWVLSSYRTEGGGEVDLVIESHREIIGLEIKSEKTFGRSDLRGLKSLEALEFTDSSRGTARAGWVWVLVGALLLSDPELAEARRAFWVWDRSGSE